MLSVAVHKDVSEYEPKIIGKLTLRSLACIAAAVIVTIIVAAYCTCVLALDSTIVMYISLTLSIPFWLMGFFKPKGLKFEVYAKYWLDYNMHDKKVFYVPSFIKIGLADKAKEKGELKYDKQYRKFATQPGIEAYSPKAGRVL